MPSCPSIPETSKQLLTTVYSRESSFSNPLLLAKEIIRDLIRYRELIWILFTRDLRAQYRQTLLGYFWLFVPILSTTIVWMFLSNTKMIQVAETPISYPAYVMIGSLVWTVFMSSVNQPLASFTQGQGIFMKLKVPPEAFIFAGMSHVVFDTAVRSCVLIPVVLLLGITPAWSCWLFPIGLIGSGLLGMSIGMLMIPLASLYNDVNRFVSTSLQFGMYLTPIVYPAPSSGWASYLINSNPLTHIVVSTRDWLTTGTGPSNFYFILIFFLSLITLFFAMIVLRVVLPHLIERMGM
jgi:lipopolysaccharide transport system permease protein